MKSRFIWVLVGVMMAGLLAGVVGLSGDTVSNVFGFLQIIPASVVVSIPYLLLGGLLAMVVRVLRQGHRAAQYVGRLRVAAQRAGRLTDEKNGFIVLSARYLRVPLSLIKTGVDLLERTQPPTDRSVIDGLLTVSEDYGKAIGTLSGRAAGSHQLIAPASLPQMQPLRPVWTVREFWGPVVGVGATIVIVHVLFVGSGNTSLPVVAILAELSIFVALCIGLFIGVGARQSQQREAAIAKQQESQRIAADEARNNLIKQAATELTQKLDAIRAFLPRMPEGQAKQLVADAANQASELTQRFSVTAAIVPPLASTPFTPFRFSVMLAQAQSLVSDAAQEKHVSIVPSTFEDVMLASQQQPWIVQIVATLLDNAITYSEESSQVDVGATVRDGVGMIKVTDHGEGIPSEKLAQLFQPFSKVEGAMSSGHPGAGLSLYLDRLLVAHLGGDIHIQSQPGHGATVTITFPVQ